MTETKFAKIIRNLGGRAYIVGGYVRDLIRGVKAKDKDYSLVGIREEDFIREFPKAERVGKSFPVYIVFIDNVGCEVAFARREWKVGTGYRGFETSFTPSITIEEDLYRRDTTMNAIALELPDRIFVDPFHGIEDIRAKKIRAVSKHFLDDPVRALRAARQSTELGFEITPETYDYMEACREELKLEPSDRIIGELKRALNSKVPSIFFRTLLRANLLDAIFPEIFDLIGKTQPSAFHPEGDAFEHSMQILDGVAKSRPSVEIRFAALCHDLGKGTTPEDMLPHHYQHETRGLDVLDSWNQRMTLPKNWVKLARFVISQHMRAPQMEKPGKIVEFLFDLRRSRIPLEDFLEIIRLDNHGKLPFHLEHARELLEVMSNVKGSKAPRRLHGEEVGEWVLKKRIEKYLEFRKEHDGV